MILPLLGQSVFEYVDVGAGDSFFIEVIPVMQGSGGEEVSSYACCSLHL